MTMLKKAAIACTLIVLLIMGAIVALLAVFPLRHSDIIERYAQIYAHDPAFIAAVIHAESKFRPYAVSRAGAQGLMQITPATGEWLASRLGLEDFTNDQLFDVEVNIMLGSFYLRSLLDGNGQDVRLALAAYNAGTGNVRKWLNDPELSHNGKTLDHIPFEETRTYIERVLFNQRVYGIIYQNRGLAIALSDGLQQISVIFSR